MRIFLLLALGLPALAQTAPAVASGTLTFLAAGSQPVSVPWVMQSPPLVSLADHATGAGNPAGCSWSWVSPSTVLVSMSGPGALDYTILAGAQGPPVILQLAALSDSQLATLTDRLLLSLD